MNNRIQELAEQAGLLGPSSRGGNAHEAAEKFAALIIAECAKACEPRTWVGLTDDEVKELVDAFYGTDIHRLKAIEAKLKELNHG
jgi:hypothetical protein